MKLRSHYTSTDSYLQLKPTQSESVVKKPQNIMSCPTVASVLHRVILTDRKFAVVAAAIAKANGQKLDDGPLLFSTVHHKRS